MSDKLKINRRDFMNGVALSLAAGTTLSPLEIMAMRNETATAYYPPALTGMRGSHVGAFEVAHQLALDGRVDWGPVDEPDSDVYDLVVVGGGISGLASAYFYRKNNPDARILILDNHDDFGGHAKRNEFDIGGRTLIGYGGSQTLEAPSGYSGLVKTLFHDLGVDVSRFDTAYDQNFYSRHGLGAGIFFTADDWGADKLLRYDLGMLEYYIPLAPSELSAAEAVKEMPISDAARAEFLRLLTSKQDQIPEIPTDDKWDYLYSVSYRDFLSRHLDIREPEVFAVLQDLTTDMCVGIEATPAGDAIAYMGLPGGKATGLPDYEEGEAYIHHFPDGNASIARLLVRDLIPAVANGSTMEDVVTARFDYGKLDLSISPVRLRLNSTVTRVDHDGDPKSARQVNVAYVRDGQACRVQARRCILACYNVMIPHMCPELPEAQRGALSMQVKAPILYTTVALRNWQAWKKLGIGAVITPGGYHTLAKLDFPVSLGAYQFANGPDDPITVHMERFPHRPNQGLSAREQRRLGQHELLTTSFETIEHNIRSQLAGMLSEGGFDPDRDIDGITVNRWAHGYADGYNDLEDPYYEDRNDERYPHVRGRKPFGRIAIANSDAGASAMLESAVEQAYRAVTDLER